MASKKSKENNNANEQAELGKHKGMSSKRLQAKRRKAATNTVTPEAVKTEDDTPIFPVPSGVKLGLAYFAVSSAIRDKQYMAAQKQMAAWQSQMQHNFPDGMNAGDRANYRMKMEEMQRKVERYKKFKERRQAISRLLGRVTGAASTMARTTMMGAGTGIIRANDKGIARDVIPTSSNATAADANQVSL